MTIASYLRFCNSVPNEFLRPPQSILAKWGMRESTSSIEKEKESYPITFLRTYVNSFKTLMSLLIGNNTHVQSHYCCQSIQLKGAPVDDTPYLYVWEHGDIARRRIYSSHGTKSGIAHTSNTVSSSSLSYQT